MDASEAGKKETKRILDEYGETPIKDISPETIARGKAAMESLNKKIGNMPAKGIGTITFKDELRDAFPVFNDELDTSFLIELLHYFPMDKVYISTGRQLEKRDNGKPVK